MTGIVVLIVLVAGALTALLLDGLRRASLSPASELPASPASPSPSPPAPAPAVLTTPAPAPGYRPWTPTLVSLRAQLAFVHQPTPNTVVLDCTLVEFDDDRDGVVPAGAPFSLTLRLPDTAWFATSLERLLEQWAAEDRVVEIALQARNGHAKAHVGDGSSRLMLEVDGAAGLGVG